MTLPCGIYNQSYQKDLALFRTKTHWGLLLTTISVVLLLPLIASDSLTNWLAMVAITILSALGLMVITGYCGQLSIGHTAFMAVGAFSYANLSTQGVPWVLAILCAGANAGLVGTFFGLSCLKVKELYLALTTLAAQFILPWVIVEFFGGGRGVVPPYPKIGAIELRHPQHFYYLAVITMLVLTYLVYNLGRTKIGRAFKAIKYQDLAAQSMGINVGLYKVFSFTIGCFIAGIAGALWAIWIGKADVEHFTIKDSIWYLAMLLTGGAGSVAGTFFGVIFILGLWELSDRLSAWMVTIYPGFDSIMASIPTLLVALTIILFILIEPRGWNHRWLVFKASYRVWPWSHW
jgi:branched-chain amino acid transport system permease protein